jgi:hypothetical protein
VCLVILALMRPHFIVASQGILVLVRSKVTVVQQCVPTVAKSHCCGSIIPAVQVAKPSREDAIC